MDEALGVMERDGEIPRPAWHFTAREGWINDPNGLIHAGGRFHLFYQHLWPRHWGHASSRDLLNWDHHPIALSPSEQGDPWSGSVASHPSLPEWTALFTQWKPNRPQVQGIAKSHDLGQTWQLDSENPVLTDPSRSDFRDPKLRWHSESQGWIAVLAAGKHLVFARSSNLRNWEITQEFADSTISSDSIYECPDLFSMTDPSGRKVWVLLGSWLSKAIFGPPRGEGPSGTVYWIGNFDGYVFSPLQPARPFSAGPDDYAPVTWDHEHGPVAIGWLNNWVYAESLAALIPEKGWHGQMTIPRRLHLVDQSAGLILHQTPAADLGPPKPLPNELRTPRGNVSIVRGPEGWILDRSQLRHPGIPEMYCRPIAWPDDRQTCRTRIVVDRFSIEVFAGEKFGAATFPLDCPLLSPEIPFWSEAS